LKTRNTLYFASHNLHKVGEIQSIVGERWHIKSLHDLKIENPIPETGTTIEANAILKASYLHKHFGVSCFADDTGLEVFSLDGEPGVYSARYAGEAKDDKANMDKLLQKLDSKEDRKAQFKTVICYIDGEGAQQSFTGIVSGVIGKEPKGTNGFGYDPIFIPDGFDITFAEMHAEMKNTISHRARAMNQLKGFLNESGI
jgi:XTP/dITP diphosphohydrolase